MNIVAAMIPMISRVSDAFLAWGRRNAGTPFEIASTPVSAVAPDENAFRITKIVTTPTPAARSGSRGIPAGSLETGHPPRHFATPTTTVIVTQRMKQYV